MVERDEEAGVVGLVVADDFLLDREAVFPKQSPERQTDSVLLDSACRSRPSSLEHWSA